MKIIFTFLIILCSSLASAQCHDTRYNSHVKRMNLKGKVKSMTEVHYKARQGGESGIEVEYKVEYTFNKDGNLLERNQTRGDGTPLAKEVYSYTTSGQITGYRSYSNDKLSSKSVCDCDEKNNVLTQTLVMPNGMAFPIFKFTYKKGKLVEQVHKDTFGKESIMFFEYNDKGHTVRYSDSPNSHNVVETDKTGSKTRDTFYEGNIITTDYQYKNDRFGNDIERIIINKGVSQTPVLTQYIYDKYNNWTERIVTYEGVTSKAADYRTFEYYK